MTISEESVTTSDYLVTISDYEGQMGYPVWGSHLGSHRVMDYKYLFIFFLNTFENLLKPKVFHF